MYETDDEIIELLLIPRVGRAKARALHSAGYKTVRDIAEADPLDLSKVPGISLELAKAMVEFTSVMSSAAEQSVDKLETSNELLICPMCGSMVSGSSNVCSGCGITFNDEVEDLTEDLKVPEEIGKKTEKDGFWYKEDDKLFICPECGSMVADGSESCPKCGVFFDMEDEPETAGATPKQDGEPDDYWYKGDSTLFMCPNCGSFIKNDAESCGSCGIVFEAGEEEEPEITTCPMCKSALISGNEQCQECGFDLAVEKEKDGFWYKDQTELFMCPGCGAFIPKSATQCANCGSILEDEEEEEQIPEVPTCPMCNNIIAPGADNCAKCGFDFTKNKEEDGFWYKDAASLFICPGCGAFLSEAADRCLNCGIVFDGEEVETDMDSAIVKAKTQAETLVRDKALEKEVDDLIELVEIEDELEGAVKAEATEKDLIAESMETIEESVPVPEDLYLCPICGAFIQANVLKCPSCKTVFDDIGEMELEPLGSVESLIEDPAALAKEMAAEIREIERELLDPPKPKKEKRSGVSKDFLDRWKKLDTAELPKVVPLTESAETPEPKKMTSQEIEDELGLDEFIEEEQDEDIDLEAEIDELADYHIDDENFWTTRARALASQGRLEEAVTCLDRAAELNPDREVQYKRLMLELMGVGPKEKAVDLSELAAIDDIGELSIDEALLAENNRTRIAEIELELEKNPNSSALWQEKGELLEKLSQHQEAIACFDKSISFSYSELRKDVRPRHTLPQIGIGLTNGEGRVNGRVNGLLIQRGMINGSTTGKINGLTNGLEKGKGRINGMINGRGRVNGLVNGGLVNGLSRGRTNGKVNGLTNGLMNGEGIGLVNGAGLINGGLVNGLGLVNGEGMVNGAGSLRKLRHRRRERMIWRYRLTAMVLFITMVLMLSMLSNLIVEEERGIINIDGNFADWNDIRGYYNFIQEQPINPELRILETRISHEAEILSIFVLFEGDAFANVTGGVDSVWAFIDIDPDLNTGYAMNDMGVDLIAEIYGWNGTVRGSRLLRFDNMADDNDWNGFSSIGSVSSQRTDQRLEASIRIPGDLAPRVSEPRILVMTIDSEGNSDITDYLMTPEPGGMVATFSQMGADIISPGTTDVILGELVLSSHSSGDSRFAGLRFNITGTGNATDLQNLVLRGQNGQYVPTSITMLDDYGYDITFTQPTVMALNTTLEMTLEADITTSASGKTLGIGLMEAAGTVGEPRVVNRNTRLHNIGLPDGFSVDGAFGDWYSISEILDPVNDVSSQNPNATFINSNIDLADTKFAIADDSLGLDSLFFELSVHGIMLGGDSLPTLRYRPGPVTTTNFTDSDGDSVPDDLDTHYQDFNNDDIPDSESMTTGAQQDLDGDGQADYPGNDWWLNTTIPASFPAPYAGRNISIYIGPIDKVHAQELGDDHAYVLIDSDDDVQTGLDLKGGRGIDYTIVISGKHNRILASELYVHDPAQPTNWAFVENISAALDWSRMEGSVPLLTLGIIPGQNFTIYLSTEDWKGSHDETTIGVNSGDLAMPVFPLTDTRSPAGNNVVINEISAFGAAEWVELCNPTAGSISISGWRIQVQRGASANYNTIYTFPVGTSVGAFGSGSEYLTVDLSGVLDDSQKRLRLVNAAGTVVDLTTYPIPTSGTTYARFKDGFTGKPVDTDAAGDWYTSILPSKGAANNRHRPRITVEKTVDKASASVGDYITYTIYYNNTGLGYADYVWINDTLPSGVQFDSSSVPYDSSAGGTYRWILTDIAPGDHSFTITTIVLDTALPGSTQTNWAFLNYTDQLGRKMVGNSDSASTFIRAISISAWKTGDKTAANPGDTITYELYYNVTGTENAANLWVNDTIPAGTVIDSSSPLPTSVSGSTYTWYFTDVAPGSYKITMSVIVDTGLADGTVLTNTLTVEGKDSGGADISPDTSTFDTTVTAPIITVDKTVDKATAAVGDTVTYTIDYNNTGSGTAKYVWVNDTLPTGTTFSSSSEGFVSFSGNTYYWEFTDVMPGDHSFTISVTIDGGVAEGTVLTNWAFLNYTDANENKLSESSASASTTAMAPSALIVLNEIYSDGNVGEWIELANPTSGSIDLTGWTIQRLQGGSWVNLVTLSGSIGTWLSGSEYFTVNLPGNSLQDNGGTVRLIDAAGMEVDRVTYLRTDAGQSFSRFKGALDGIPEDSDSDTDWYISNNAWLVPEGPTQGAPNDRKRPIMDVDKTATPLTAEPGEYVTYTIWYNNTGDGNAKDVWVNDTLPAGVDFISANPAPTSITGQDLVWYFNNVVHDTNNFITVTVEVNDIPADSEVVTNNVDLVYHDALRRPMGSSSAQASFTCVRPQITVEKVADVSETVAGGTIVYTIYYNNTGSTNAGSVWINDTLPAGVTFVSANPAPDSITGLVLSWHLTSVAPGTHSITVTVTVNATTVSGTITNWAYLDYSSGYGYSLESSSDSATVVIPEMQNLVLPIFGIIFIVFTITRKRRQ